ncbi:MAG: DUF4386 domain-containing protein, partial [Anaerolineaceae bacterium]|nr:DUF4386 domain-containing protein [Anaerolineaceae bacterium]
VQKRRYKMNNFRKLAISAGILFIIYTCVDVLSSLFLGPVTATNYLVSVSENAGLVGTGAFLLLIGGACASGIAISLYPVLKKSNPVLALGAVGFRISEGVLRFVSVCILLSIITLSQLFVKAGAPESSYFQTLGELLLAARGWVSHVGALLAFSIWCTLYYIIFYQTKLVPRWISVWGLVFGILGIVSCALVSTGLIAPFSTVQVVMLIPMLPQEIVLAVWLIVKGFNPSAIASLSAKTATDELSSAA